MTVELKFGNDVKEESGRFKMGKVKLMNPIEKAKQNPKSLRAAINAKCYDCCCYQKPEVKHCTAGDCPLHHLRPYQPKAN